ncbi:alpha/beta hydrolase [Streptomyces sp. NPDC007100]|uniref:alpha/beta fold hydrolase n=1 Tax=Streptomyces sp. NPDC007100 TaxID=3155602 RepID=UPI0033E5B579
MSHPYLKVNGTTLYYEDHREGEGRHGGPPLLFLHGWGTSGRVWGGQLPEFARDHRVVTVDWRGCGRSARPAQGNTVDGVVADLAALVEALDLRRPVVVGSSIGAAFATELAARHPGRTAGVVSVSGPAYWPSQGAVPIRELCEGLREDRAGCLARWVPAWFAPGASPALVDWTVRQVLDSGVFIDDHFPPLAAYDPRPLLPGLTVPVHYLHGELDTEIPLDVARTCAALTPGARATTLAGAGHLPHQERPAVFNAALRDALAAMAPAD